MAIANGYTTAPAYNVKPLATGVALSEFANKGTNSTNFQRLEDIAEDPNKPGSFYFTTTGTKKPAGKPLDPDVATPDLAERMSSSIPVDE
jgi:sugar lactone lactonase YvrE